MHLQGVLATCSADGICSVPNCALHPNSVTTPCESELRTRRCSLDSPLEKGVVSPVLFGLASSTKSALDSIATATEQHRLHWRWGCTGSWTSGAGSEVQ